MRRVLHGAGEVMLGIVLVEFVIGLVLGVVGMIVVGFAWMLGLSPPALSGPMDPVWAGRIAGWFLASMGLLFGGFLLVILTEGRDR